MNDPRGEQHAHRDAKTPEPVGITHPLPKAMMEIGRVATHDVPASKIAIILAIFGGIGIAVMGNKISEHPKAIWIAAWIIIITFAAIVLYAASLLSRDKASGEGKADQPKDGQSMATAMSFGESLDELTVTVGSIGMVEKRSKLEAGEGQIPIGNDDGTQPLHLHVKGGALYVDALFSDGTNVGEIKDNKLTRDYGGWDFNWNDDAMEVVDQNGDPIFQMIRLREGHFQVNGLIPMGGESYMFATPDGSVMPVRASYDRRGKLRPIFKHPRWHYKGQFADPPVTQPTKRRALDAPRYDRLLQVTFEVAGSTKYTLTSTAQPIFKGKSLRVYAWLEDQELCIDYESHAENLAMRIRGGDLEGQPDGWDLNSNEKATELIDPQGISRLQLIGVHHALIGVYGMFFDGSTVTIADVKGIRELGKDEQPADVAPPPIFKYPSKEHPGEFSERVQKGTSQKG